MRGVNKVILVGTLGRDPEVRYAANGNAIANISLATSEQWNDKNTGQKQEKTEWHRVAFFGRLAEIVGQYATKGTQMYVEGKLQTRKWQDQSGQDRYTTEVVVDGFNGQMQLLGGGNRNQTGMAPAPGGMNDHYGAPAPNQGGNDYGNQPAGNDYAPQPMPGPQPAASAPTPKPATPATMPNTADFDDDIPF